MEAGFKVFGKASVSIEPSEGALDNPAPGQDDKPLYRVATLDDLDPPPTDLVEGGRQLDPAITTVGKDMPQPRIEIAGAGQDPWCAVAILDVGLVNDRRERQAGGVSEQVALASLQLLAGVIARGPPASVVLTDWLSMTPALGLAPRPLASRTRITRA